MFLVFVGGFACCVYFNFSHIHFSPPFTSCKKAPGELMMEVSDGDKERDDSDGNFFQYFRPLDFFLRRLKKENGIISTVVSLR